MKAGGGAKPFYAVIFDSNGNSIDLASPVTWEMILPQELNAGQISIASQEGNTIKLKASPLANIGSSFILRMSINDAAYGNFKAELEVAIGGIL